MKTGTHVSLSRDQTFSSSQKPHLNNSDCPGESQHISHISYIGEQK